MPKIQYVARKFTASSRETIDNANSIIAEYAEQGFILTLRQLYYQFVSRDLIPNTPQSYKKLGSIINDARLAGEIDWETIEDRTRNLIKNPHWSTPAEILKSARDSYAIDKWEGQKYRPEVWIEKDALVGVIAGVCQRLDVSYFSCRGYTSQSEMWAASQRYQRIIRRGQIPFVIHLGDHDPSGIDMSRDIGDRLGMFLDDEFPVKRIALNMDQIEEYSPPPNPAKTTDSRFVGYIKHYGEESWELDALEPGVIADLIEETILQFRDEEQWESRVELQEMGRKQLSKMIDSVG